MKKFINPEMNVSRFDVENIVTGSTASQTAEFWLEENGIKIGGTPVESQGTVTFIF